MLSAVPPNVRRLSWDAVKPKVCNTSESIKVVGKGTFAICYTTELGSMRVCVKVLYNDRSYKSLFFKEAKFSPNYATIISLGYMH